MRSKLKSSFILLIFVFSMSINSESIRSSNPFSEYTDWDLLSTSYALFYALFYTYPGDSVYNANYRDNFIEYFNSLSHNADSIYIFDIENGDTLNGSVKRYYFDNQSNLKRYQWDLLFDTTKIIYLSWYGNYNNDNLMVKGMTSYYGHGIFGDSCIYDSAGILKEHYTFDYDFPDSIQYWEIFEIAGDTLSTTKYKNDDTGFVLSEINKDITINDNLFYNERYDATYESTKIKKVVTTLNPDSSNIEISVYILTNDEYVLEEVRKKSFRPDGQQLYDSIFYKGSFSEATVWKYNSNNLLEEYSTKHHHYIYKYNQYNNVIEKTDNNEYKKIFLYDNDNRLSRVRYAYFDSVNSSWDTTSVVSYIVYNPTVISPISSGKTNSNNSLKMRVFRSGSSIQIRLNQKPSPNDNLQIYSLNGKLISKVNPKRINNYSVYEIADNFGRQMMLYRFHLGSGIVCKKVIW